MACGCALVTTDNGGSRDYAFHKKNALISPPNNSHLLAQNIIKLLKEDDLRIRLAKSGYEYVQQLTWERSTNLLERLMLTKNNCPSD
jgi:glycosyltransferase involved in cell wall biosynthesis